MPVWGNSPFFSAYSPPEDPERPVGAKLAACRPSHLNMLLQKYALFNVSKSFERFVFITKSALISIKKINKPMIQSLSKLVRSRLSNQSPFTPHVVGNGSVFALELLPRPNFKL